MASINEFSDGSATNTVAVRGAGEGGGGWGEVKAYLSASKDKGLLWLPQLWPIEALTPVVYIVQASDDDFLPPRRPPYPAGVSEKHALPKLPTTLLQEATAQGAAVR